ncbi:MAG: thioredoxin domain-containing protein [Acidobacteriota bacterium]
MSANDTTHTNRLAGESSPYLLLHQHNPVDWHPWGPEALETARREGKPIFLSVGYSTCYWCHVMERESFSDPEVAERMNRDFVNIKVDREERPDVDELYMVATQILSGQGGWPNSVFLTPDLRPYYAGTYFPPTERHGRPSFRTVLDGLADAWRNRRDEVEMQAEEMEKAMRHHLQDRAEPAAAPPGPEVAVRSLDALVRRFDRQWGGFGNAPKFPTPSNLFLCLDLAAERPEAGELLSATLDQMARGGIYDQLGGGFHRYATDREWKVPHFEKMLYDNGFLLELYAREHERTGDPQAARIARGTVDWLMREMASPEGAFWSAVDAETHGHEGAYYVWTRDELFEILGREDAAFLAPILGFDAAPFFEGDRYVLHLPERIERAAERRKMDPAELQREVGALEAKLLEARSQRDRPLTDDKILADWNGTVIGGLAAAGKALGDPALIERAAAAARFVVETMRSPDGVLLHAWRGGRGKIAAYLEDYAFLVRGLLILHKAGGDDGWLRAAAELTEEQIRRLRDVQGGQGGQGGFFGAAESPDLLFRSKDVFDGAMPAANAVAILNLLELAERTGEGRWMDEARAALRAFAPMVQTYPDGARMMSVAARCYHRAAVEAVDSHAAWERGAQASGVDKLTHAAEGLVGVRLEETGDAGDGWRRFRMELEIRPGWHIQANPASEEYLVPTEVVAEGGAEVRGLSYPQGETMAAGFVGGRPLAVYAGRVEVIGEVKRGEVKRGGGRLVVRFQPCDDSRCLPPVEHPVLLES